MIVIGDELHGLVNGGTYRYVCGRVCSVNGETRGDVSL